MFDAKNAAQAWLFIACCEQPMLKECYVDLFAHKLYSYGERGHGPLSHLTGSLVRFSVEECITVHANGDGKLS